MFKVNEAEALQGAFGGKPEGGTVRFANAYMLVYLRADQIVASHAVATPPPAQPVAQPAVKRQLVVPVPASLQERMDAIKRVRTPNPCRAPPLPLRHHHHQHPTPHTAPDNMLLLPLNNSVITP